MYKMLTHAIPYMRNLWNDSENSSLLHCYKRNCCHHVETILGIFHSFHIRIQTFQPSQDETHLQDSRTALASISVLYSISGEGSHISSTDTSICKSVLVTSCFTASASLAGEGFGLVTDVTSVGVVLGFTVTVSGDVTVAVVVLVEITVLAGDASRFEGENGPELRVLLFCGVGSSSLTSSSSPPEPKCLSRSSARDVAMSFWDNKACSSWSLTANSFDDGELGGKAWWYETDS